MCLRRLWPSACLVLPPVFSLRAAGLALALNGLAVGGPVFAHEFWLEPDLYRIAADGVMAVRAYNGEEFEGTEFPFNAQRWARSGVIAGAAHISVSGETGTKPAVAMAPAGEGLNVVYHASPIASLIYAEMERFERFLRGKRLQAALKDHAELGLPETQIRESYFRYVKALVAVGDGAGADAPVGMPYELVALDNPYTTEGPIRVQVLGDRTPVASAPVYVFVREGGTGGAVETQKLLTDAKGVVEIGPTAGEVMVNAVRILRPDAELAERTGAHWVTHWAALTYEAGVE